MSKPSRAIHAAVETGVVADLTHEAEGVIRSTDGAGKVVFVSGALPGERVSFRRVSFHRGHDEAELVEVLEPSAQRVTPRCAHFGVCGGCALQHLAPAAQLEAKQKELAENLARIGNVAPDEWLPPLLGPVWGYRRRARLSSRYVSKKGRSLVGFREKQGKYVADVSRCEVLVEPRRIIGRRARRTAHRHAAAREHSTDRGGVLRRRAGAGAAHPRCACRSPISMRCVDSNGVMACASCCSPAVSIRCSR